MLWQQVNLLNSESSYELLAGGSLGHPPATVRPRFQRRAWLWAELAVFFIGVPLLLRWAIHDLHVPLLLVLQPLLLGFIVYLLWDDTFHVRRELLKRRDLPQRLRLDFGPHGRRVGVGEAGRLFGDLRRR